MTVGPGPVSDANLYDISSPIRVNFSRSSITGVPQLSYQDTELNLKFEGKELDIRNTPIGDLVTVTVQSTPDASDRRVTLLVPVIRVSPGEETRFETILLETLDRSTTLVPTPGPTGVLQNYRIHQLQGIAQRVDF